MNTLKDYTGRKFYSKVGRASNASSKPHYPTSQNRSYHDITMDYIRDELEKARIENIKKLRLRKKHQSNTSSFLSTTRETYMRQFKLTSSETPIPGKYSPNIDFIKPSPSPVLRFREHSEGSKSRLISLPSCIDTSVFECLYPKKTENSTISISELEKQADEKRFLKSKSLKKNRNLVVFERQTKRLFLPYHKVADERFEQFNHFPKISSKAKRLPVIDFTYYIDRREENLRNSPCFYDYDDRIAKSTKALHNFDMGKVPGRNLRDEWKPDTVNKDKVNESFGKVMPGTYVSGPCFEKMTDRNFKAPGARSFK